MGGRDKLGDWDWYIRTFHAFMLGCFSVVRLCNPVDLHTPLLMGFSRQEYWSGLPFPTPGDLSNCGIEPSSLMSPALAGRFFATSATWEAHIGTESESDVAQSCPTLCDPMDCSLSGSSVHGIFQAIILEWVAISFSMGSSWPRDWTQVSHIAGRHWATIALPIRTRSSYPHHQSLLQEASISLLSLSVRGQAEWKPQSQKTYQTDHMNHSLV